MRPALHLLSSVIGVARATLASAPGPPQYDHAAVREAMLERIKKHKASPVTDPFRQMIYPKVNGRTLHKTPESQDWKAN
jgi:hypothetical protein